MVKITCQTNLHAKRPSLPHADARSAATVRRRLQLGRHKIHFFILSMLVVMLGGFLTFFWQEQQRQVSHAAGDVVVGPPSLSAADVDAIFTRLGSPMAGTGQTVVADARSTHIDDAFALGVWWAETNDGMAGVGVGYHNPGGVQASPNYPSTGYTDYPSYAAAETDWFTIVENRYINRGLTSVYTICYPYVGTSGALNWANKVMNYMTSYRASAPPPPAAIIRKPVPKAAVVVRPKATASTANTHKTSAPIKQAQVHKITAPVAARRLNVNMANTQTMPQSTQLLLIGLGLLVAMLLAVPGLLIRRKLPASGQIGQRSVEIPVSITALQDQATQDLPVTAALSAGTMSAAQLKSCYTNQYSPVLAGQVAAANTINAASTVNTNQPGFAFDMSPLSPMPAMPAAPPFTERTSMLQPEPVAVGRGTVIVPQTPLQRIPATPLFQRVPATPLLAHSSQGGLLTRYNMQHKPRRIELTRSSGNTNPREIVPRQGEAELQAGGQTETLR